MVYNLFPETEVILNKMGEQIKMARMRRNIPAELMAEQAGISRSVLHMLDHMESDFLFIAKNDECGRKLQDLSLMTRKRVNADKMTLIG